MSLAKLDFPVNGDGTISNLTKTCSALLLQAVTKWRVAGVAFQLVQNWSSHGFGQLFPHESWEHEYDAFIMLILL